MTTKNIFSTLGILGMAAAFTACEDVITVDVPNGKKYTVVDAWLTDEAGKQTFRLTETVPYASTGAAPVVNDAIVTLTDVTINKVYPFTFSNGAYSHDPGADQRIGVVNHAYKLRIELKGEVFEAFDTIRRVPQIDSITYEFKTAEDAASGEEGYYAKFHGRDLAGGTDFYWVRSYRNNRTTRVADAFPTDGAFNENVADSAAFIVPIAESITRFDKPFLLNETVIVRLASCTRETHGFLTHVDAQLNIGGLFATVLENVRGNVKNVNTSSKTRLLGWFGASAVSFKEKKMQ